MPAPLAIMAMRSAASLGGGRDGEVIVDDGRHLARQRLGAQIRGVIEQPRGDLAQAAIAGERQTFRVEIGADQLLGALGA